MIMPTNLAGYLSITIVVLLFISLHSLQLSFNMFISEKETDLSPYASLHTRTKKPRWLCTLYIDTLIYTSFNNENPINISELA